MKMKLLYVLTLTFALRLLGAPLDSAPTATAFEALKFDTESKEFAAKPSDANATFDFVATNVSKEEVSINALRTSCGCTVAQLPNTPYPLAPGSNVTINVSMNLAGKSGVITKSVTVESSA